MKEHLIKFFSIFLMASCAGYILGLVELAEDGWYAIAPAWAIFGQLAILGVMGFGAYRLLIKWKPWRRRKASNEDGK